MLAHVSALGHLQFGAVSSLLLESSKLSWGIL